jgi:hypothetical protein
MEPENNAPSASADTPAIEPMSQTAAADMLANLDPHPSAALKVPKPSPEPEQSAPEEEASTEEDDAAPAEQAESEATPEESETVVHGNTMLVLRDGTKVRASDARKALGELQEYRAREEQLTAYGQQLQARTDQIAQRQQYYANTLSNAIAVLRTNIPAEPSAELKATDPIEYFLQKDAREAKIGELRRLEHARQAEVQQTQVQQAQATQAFLQQEQKRLFAKIPELATPAKRSEFYRDMVDVGRNHYGFSDQEMNDISDHRIMLMARDAMAWRKFQAQEKPKAVEKAKHAVPVSKPAPRQASHDSRSSKQKALFQQAQKSGGRIDNVAAFLSELD